MPTNLFRSKVSFDDTSFNILATMGDLASPRMITVDPTTIAPGSDGSKILAPGTILIRGNGAAAGLGRAFPGSYIVNPVTASVLAVRNANVFRAGDVVVRGLPGATVPIGTILSVDGVLNRITLTANALNAVAANDPIWADLSATIAEDIVGIIVAPHDVVTEPNDLPGYLSAAVYKERMPFWNSVIKNALPEIKTVP